MKQLISMVVLSMALAAPVARAYEYPLQFTPNAGYRGLVVAGYMFDASNDVIGTCSYYTVSGASPRGGRGHTTVYNQICKWDAHGNLLSMTKGTITAPPPLSTKGSLVVYAMNGNGDTTGTDAKLPERGFVSTPGAHYTWLTPNGNAVLQHIVYHLTVSLRSDGDMPLHITAVQPSALNGTVTLKDSTCNGQIKVDATCSIHVVYDPTKLTSSTGLISDTFRIDLTSDAGEAHDFIQKFTIIAQH